MYVHQKTPFFYAIIALNALKHRTRKGWTLRGVKEPESVAEHSWKSAVIALALAPPKMNKGKVLSLALLDDLSEVFAEDITPLDGLSKDEKEKVERRAVEKFVSLLPEKNRREWKKAWQEVEEGKTPEARFVKECEVLEMLFQALEYEQAGNFERDLTGYLARDSKRITLPALKKLAREIDLQWPLKAKKKFDPKKHRYYY